MRLGRKDEVARVANKGLRFLDSSTQSSVEPSQ